MPIKNLSSRMDELIEFGVTYPKRISQGPKWPNRSPWSFRTPEGKLKTLIPVGRKDPTKYRILNPVKSVGTSPLGLAVRKLRAVKELSAMLDDLIEFADPRPRNPLGEFTHQEGGPDPNAMATVYKMPQTQPQHQGPGIPKLAGAALVGGALGQIGGNIGKEGWAGMTNLVKHLSSRAKKIRR